MNNDNLNNLFENIFKQPELDDFKNDFELAEYFQKVIINASTNDGPPNDQHYKSLRKHFLDNEETKDLIPSWVRTNRNLSEFWQYIKVKFKHYAERRTFIWKEFINLMNYLETQNNLPHKNNVEQKLKTLNSEYIMATWNKALKRKDSDPEGAITISRTLIESVLKTILDELKMSYTKDSDLHYLYKLVAKELNLSPDQHNEQIFKQILGGCSGIVSGLGNLRNNFGDAHGKGKKVYKPAPRHAELSVNLSGTICLFILQTFEFDKNNKINAI